VSWASGFAFGCALSGITLLLLAYEQDAVTKSQLLNPSVTYFNAETIHKPIQIDTKTHITEVSKIEYSNGLVPPLQERAGTSSEPVQHVTPATKAHTAPDNEISAYIDQVFGRDSDIAKRVVQAESSWNPNAIHHNTNGTYDFCLFQINSVHGYSKDYLSNFRNCVDAAYRLFRAQGWSPWLSSKHAWAN
jgi:Transglycosylase SLT domain